MFTKTSSKTRIISNGFYCIWRVLKIFFFTNSALMLIEHNISFLLSISILYLRVFENDR